MEITLDKAEFTKSITRIQGIVERKNTMPVLANCLIKAGKNGIQVMATDLDVTIIDSCPAKLKKSGPAGGGICLNAKKLYEIFRELEEGEVALTETESYKVELKTQSRDAGFVCELQGINPEEFPVLPKEEGFQFFELEPELLTEMITKTIYCSATEEGRFVLSGIFMEKLENEWLRFVATDGHRMAVIDREVAGSKELVFDKGVILPKKGMSELVKLFSAQEAEKGKIKLGVKDNHLVVKTENTIIFMRLVDGEFPEYKRVIPEDNPIKVNLERDHFLKSLRLASVMVDEKARSVKLNFSKGKLLIEGKHPTYGRAEGECPCDYQGQKVEVGFNDRYLFDILTSVGAGKITMEIKDELSPVLFRTETDTKYLCVVMPMRI